MNSQRKVAAGIVLYNPSIDRLKKNIDAVVSQSERIILFDNGSDNIEEIEELLKLYGHTIILLKSSENTGIAHALNKIAELALRKNYEWLLTLDQDTVLKPNLVKKYLKYINLPDVGQLCCDFVDRNTGKREYNNFGNSEYKEIDKWITSGSLINLNILKILGGFDEDLFIDYVDFDICFAMRKNGFENYIINTVGMIHEIGSRKEYKFMFKNIDVMNHSAFRHFYITRNQIIVYKRYPNESLPNMNLLQLKTIIKIILFENNKISKIRAVNRGFLQSRSTLFNNRKDFL